MVKKKIDNRIRVMIENGVKLGHRTMFIIIGDKGRDQVPILYDILTKSTVKSRPSVLWCYKNKDEAISKYVTIFKAQVFLVLHYLIICCPLFKSWQETCQENSSRKD